MADHKGIGNIKWTQAKLDKLRRLGVVTTRGGKHFIDDREIVLPQDVNEKLEEVYREEVPPNCGILRLKAYIDQRYAGVRRKQITDFLQHRPNYVRFQRLHNISHTLAIVVSAPGKRFQIDHKSFPVSGPPQGGYTGMMVAVDLYSHKAWVYPHRGDETSQTNRTAMQHLLDHDLPPERQHKIGAK